MHFRASMHLMNFLRNQQGLGSRSSYMGNRTVTRLALLKGAIDDERTSAESR